MKTITVKDKEGRIWEISDVFYTEEENVFDCEVKHPDLGWIPFTANPEDTDAQAKAIHKKIKDAHENGDIPIGEYNGLTKEEKEIVFFRETTEVSKFQLKAALMQSDLLSDVKEYIASADAMTQLAWEEENTFVRSSFIIDEIREALDMTGEQMDDIFRFSMTIGEKE